MVIYENGKYTPCTYKVTLKNRGREEAHYTKNKEYWEDMVAKHSHLQNLVFKEIILIKEQKNRLQKINEENVPRGFLAEVRKYVREGKFPVGYKHPLLSIKLLEEKEKYQDELDDAYQIMLESEGLI